MTSVGIDVSKGKTTVCILKPYGEVVTSPYEVWHTGEEIHALVTRIRSIDGEVRIVPEATGVYHLPLAVCFKEAGLFVSVTNPLAMKKYASASIRKGKTDKLDSVRIANYGIDNWKTIRFRMSSTHSFDSWDDSIRTTLQFVLRASWL